MSSPTRQTFLDIAPRERSTKTAFAVMGSRACGCGISAGRPQMTGEPRAPSPRSAWRCTPPIRPFSRAGSDGRIPRGVSEYPAAFNRFIDHFGLLDAELTPLASSDRAIAALLPRDAAPFPFAGRTVIVVDTSDPTAPPSDPVEAQAIQTRFADWLASTAHDPRAATDPGQPAANVINTGSHESLPRT